MVLQRFNALGPDGHSCPLCFRRGSLIGHLHAGAVLTCNGCFRTFRFEPPETMARLDTSRAPQKRCACGSLIGLLTGSDTCQVCIAQAEREARNFAAGNRWAA
jgi:hypothetical protein